MFRKVLIANRGEIAVRVAQGCHELGIAVVAVYSEADRDALHTTVADEAYLLGPPPAAESYLNIPRLIEVAQRSGAEAVHPGYGFLAENAAFAAACAAAGLVFIGPSPAALRLLGDKAAAKQLARRARVPVVPGYQGASQSARQLAARAAAVGYPLLIKAVAGGGGRGMRRVGAADEFAQALAGAQREAQAAFGDARVLLERDVTPARHVEVQFLADAHGRALAVGERDCSVQRRHQKILEEAPAPGLDAAERARLGRWATRLARAAGYVGAGTAEFLRDADGRYYFLEVNARLQVEHPVSELVHGLDLVHWQLRIAAGERLTPRPADVAPRGHAIEVRLYAEDPAHGYQPTTGPVLRFVPPLGAGLRHDVGVRAGDVVSRWYDTLLAKLIVHAPTRDAALARLAWALDRYAIQGLPTNQALLRALVAAPDFQAARLSTGFLDEHPALLAPPPLPAGALWAATAADVLGLAGSAAGSPWTALGPWRNAAQPRQLRYRVGDVVWAIDAQPLGMDTWRVEARQEMAADGAALEHGPVRLSAKLHGGQPQVRVDNAPLAADVLAQDAPPGWRVQIGGQHWLLLRPAAPAVGHGEGAGATGAGGASERAVYAPTTGVVAAVYVQVGDEVAAGQPLVAVESMKIEQTLAAPSAGRVREIGAAVGDSVAGGALLVALDPLPAR